MSSKKLKGKGVDLLKLSLHRCDKCDLQFFNSLVNEHKSGCGALPGPKHTFIRNDELYVDNVLFTPLPEDLQQFKEKV